MAKRSKLSIGIAVFSSIIFLLVGACLGVAGKIFLFGDAGYYIPETEAAKQSVAKGSMDVDVIKQQELSIHFIELGNKYTGDCTFIKVGDVEILIDAGSKATSVQPIYEYVSQYVEGKLDYVIVTHAHQDHYAGFATGENTDSLFDLFDTNIVIQFAQSNQKPTAKLFNNFKREIEQTKTEKGTKVYTSLECYDNSNGAQRVYELGNNVTLEILKHKYYTEKAHTENDYSVCCMINQKIDATNSRHYLFTGDLEEDGEESLVDTYLAENGKNLPEVVLYKAGHHGSKTSSSSKMLEVISPEIVCVCCCAGSSEYTSKNENQFPTQAFIDRIAPYTSQVYVTTLCLDYNKGSFESFNGNIVISSNASENVKVACANNDKLLKDTDWFAANRIMPDAWKKEIV